MSRTKPVTIAVNELPFYLRNETEADLVALALEAQADMLADQNAGEGLSAVVRASTAATVAAYRAGAARTREVAKLVVRGPATAGEA